MSALGILADIHANAPALEAVRDHAAARGVTRFVNLGDVLRGPLWPAETFALLERMDIAATIRGNQDRRFDSAAEPYSPAARAWLAGLPFAATLPGGLFLFHGSPASDTGYLLEEITSGRAALRPLAEIEADLQGIHASLLLCGHTHLPRLVQLSDGRLILNPGSVGLPAYEDSAPVPHVIECGSPHASYAILRGQPGAWEIDFHRVAYDARAAARRALALGRPDWARGLEYGCM